MIIYPYNYHVTDYFKYTYITCFFFQLELASHFHISQKQMISLAYKLEVIRLFFMNTLGVLCGMMLHMV